MTYREKLELYSQGKLDGKEKIEIEKELEKQEALSEYLFEHQLPPGMDDLFESGSAFDDNTAFGEESSVKDDTEDVAKQINKSIKRAFRKTGIIAIIIAVILTLFIVFALPHIVSAFFYNPGNDIGANDEGTQIEQLEADMSVFAEYHIPELGPSLVAGSEGYGYGNYSYSVFADFSAGEGYGSTNITLSGNLKRNDFSCFNNPVLYEFDRDHFDNQCDELVESVNNMSETDLYYVYVAFASNMPYEKFYNDFVDMDSYGTNCSWVWCGVNVSDDENAGYHEKEGFFAKSGDNYSQFPYDEEKYPNLTWRESSKELKTEKMATEHFSSILDYLNDSGRFLSLDNCLRPGAALVGNQMDYIEKHGMNIYGFIYVTDKTHVKNILTAKGVSQVAVEKAD